MDTNSVMERFIKMAGLSAERAEEFRSLCEDAAAELGRRAVPGGEGQAALCAAAAALAFYRWVLIIGAAGSFSAGDVKITKNAGDAAMARETWREALAAAAPFLEDRDFLFRRTRP